MDFGSSFSFKFYKNRITFLENKTAILDYDTKKEYRYSDLTERSDRMAFYLTQVVGLRKGDRVGICAKNDIAFFDLFFAAYKTGLILTTYNGRLRDWELERLINNESPAVLFTDDYYVEKIRTAADKQAYAPKVVELAGRTYQDIMSAEGKPASFLPDSDDILMLIHTGGTTGTPKAAMLSYRAVTCNSISTALTHNLTPEDSTYLMLPLFHTAAWNSVSLGILLAGGTLILKKDFQLDDAYDIIQNLRPTFLLGVPTIYQRIAQDPRFETADFSSVLAFRCGAAPLPIALFEQYDRRGLPMCNAYGLSECGPSNFSFPMRLTTMEQLRDKAGSVGRPMYFNRVRIVDEEGNELPAMEKGELEFTGPLTFSGYWNQKEESDIVRDQEWIRTGDIAYCDEEGFYYIVGRKKNMFISGGENIYPVEIENELLQVECVQDACVIGIPSREWGEVGKAFIQLKPGAQEQESLKEIRTYMEQRMPRIKRPCQYAFIEKIPRNNVGKLLLGEVRRINEGMEKGENIG